MRNTCAYSSLTHIRERMFFLVNLYGRRAPGGEEPNGRGKGRKKARVEPRPSDKTQRPKLRSGRRRAVCESRPRAPKRPISAHSQERADVGLFKNFQTRNIKDDQKTQITFTTFSGGLVVVTSDDELKNVVDPHDENIRSVYSSKEGHSFADPRTDSATG